MTIWQKIGTAFRNGWKNGNLAKGISAVGMGAFTVGMTGAMIHDINKKNNCCDSIFGNLRGNKYLNLGHVRNGYYDVYSMPFLNDMGTNPYLSMQGQQDAYLYGALLAQRQLQTQPLQLFPTQNESATQIKRNNKDAGDIDTDTTVDLGKNFNETTNKFGETDSDVTEFQFSKKQDGTEDAEQYKKDIKALAQSYIKYIDENNDGHISEEEFIEQEIKQFRKEKPNASEADIAKAKMTIKEKFALMNLNKDDNGLDWKEISAALASYDAGGNSDGRLDGKITREEFKNAQDSLDKLKFGNTAWSFYQKLFPDEE